ncbi:MAG: hypothetical protein OEM22_05700 [Acidimicrobiia bacterium]|nr:hypothetical protein [Acidimicrobiia bacterium]
MLVSGNHASGDVELVESLFGSRVMVIRLGNEDSSLGIIDRPYRAGQVALVVDVFGSEGVKGKAAISIQILSFGGWNQESVKALIGDDGTDRVEPWPSVGTDRGKETQADPVLVEQLLGAFRHLRSILCKRWPTGHEPSIADQFTVSS